MRDDVPARALDVNEAQFPLGNECFEADGGRFVRNLDAPRVHDANHVSHVTASTPGEIDRLLARVEREYDGLAHRAFHTDYRTPPQFEARLALDGYTTYPGALVMLLEGELRRPPPARRVEITRVDDGASWAAIDALRALDWAEGREKQGRPPEPEVGAMMARTRRLKSPPFRLWLAREDGAPRGYFGSWAGIDGMGQVEDLFVQREYRNRGLATALLHHCVADARAQGAGPVVIVADVNDTPKRIYAALGWRPVAVKRSWVRMVG